MPGFDLSVRRAQLAQSAQCADSPDACICSNACVCAITQETGADFAACRADLVAAATDPAIPPGFCYVNDPASPLLAACASNQKRTLRFVGSDAAPTPTPGAALFIACGG
jgi:hypothetical protein